MGEDKNVLARWARLKRKHGDEEEPKTAARASEAAAASQPHSTATDAESPVPFDVSSLPPVESIVAGSDIRAFLQKGVPTALTRAALRRAWSSDPAIRDFIEMAENQWDFSSPASIPGFGPLTVEDDVPQLVAKALGGWPNDRGPETETGMADNQAVNSPQTRSITASSPQSVEHSGTTEPPLPEPEQTSVDEHEPSSALQQDRCGATDEPSTTRRRRLGHGGALPS
jgi:hypothetical protein